jgi:hypothetical protein
MNLKLTVTKHSQGLSNDTANLSSIIGRVVNALKSPMAANFAYEEDGIYFRVYSVRYRIKVYARMGYKTVIEFGNTHYEAADKAKKRLMTKQL